MTVGERGQNRVYRKIYRDHHGDGPYTCSHCLDLMDHLEVVHHEDEDASNNDIGNLSAMHTTCHNRHHHIGLTHTEEIKAQIGASVAKASREGRRGKPDVAGEKNGFYGKKHTEEARAKMKAAWARRREAKQ